MPEARQKVLLVVTQGDWGGAQRYVFDLANNLAQDKFEVGVVFGSNHRGELVTNLEALEKRFIRLNI